MIIATAGHVDHGKTTLLQAITGVNADRLPEEKARGMTIDLGYAYWPQPDGRVLGFIDVPGHEKFLSNMLAGVGGIDHALLVVACDDGVMAQTREHLAILQLTGKPSLTIALTKADRVEAARIEEVEAEIDAVLAEFGFTGAVFSDDLSMKGARQLEGRELSYTEAAITALEAGCDLVLLCNQSLGDGSAVDDLIAGLAQAQAQGRWQPSPDSEARRLALLPQTLPTPWDELMLQPAYMQALDLLP